MASARQNPDAVRVLLWCVPRSVSTCFLQCMTYVPNSQVWFEPYDMALGYSRDGPYRDSLVGWYIKASGLHDGDIASYGSDVSGGYWAADKSYSWIKKQLQGPVPKDKEIVFVKDQARAVDGKYEYIPDGFRHTFLIRHPYKVFTSLERMLQRVVKNESHPKPKMKLSEADTYYLSSGHFYKEQYDLYQYVRENGEPNPVVIDTEDLLTNPGGVLKAYCEEVGIPFTEDLLQWNAGTECLDKQWMIAKEYIMAFTRREMCKWKPLLARVLGKPSPVPDRESVSDDTRHYSDLCMEYYNAMYNDRLQI